MIVMGVCVLYGCLCLLMIVRLRERQVEMNDDRDSIVKAFIKINSLAVCVFHPSSYTLTHSFTVINLLIITSCIPLNYVVVLPIIFLFISKIYLLTVCKKVDT